MTTSSPGGADEAARWMVQQFIRNGCRLKQEEAFKHILQSFGEAFVDTRRQKASIARSVLDKFQELTGDAVVWDMNEGGWRKRDVGART
jgi:hypothetical protein